jgi:hypothetical protein
MSVRFYAIGTLRGALKKPKLLNDANQWRAFSAWRMDLSREERVRFEMSETVVWSGPRAVGKVRTA